MLNYIKIKNIGSIKKEVVIDFKRSKYTYKENMLCNNNKNINPHAIFGANASGKTVVLKVLDTLQQIMNSPLDSLQLFIPFIDENLNSVSQVTLSFEYLNKEFIYEINTNFKTESITYEKLEVNNLVLLRKDLSLIISNGNDIVNHSLLPNKSYSGIRKIGLEEYDESSPLYYVKQAYDYLSSITFIDVRGFISGKIVTNNNIKDLMVKNNKYVNRILLSYREFPTYELAFDKGRSYSEKKLMFKRDGSNVFLPELLMSHGMNAMSKILTIMLIMKPGTLLVVDELERSLHPFVAKQFIEEINEKFTVQLLFSSHNTNLLQSLRPDQIYFSRWDKEYNQSRYIKLSSEYPSIREVNNIEKMYYGGMLDE